MYPPDLGPYATIITAPMSAEFGAAKHLKPSELSKDIPRAREALKAGVREVALRDTTFASAMAEINRLCKAVPQYSRSEQESEAMHRITEVLTERIRLLRAAGREDLTVHLSALTLLQDFCSRSALVLLTAPKGRSAKYYLAIEPSDKPTHLSPLAGWAATLSPPSLTLRHTSTLSPLVYPSNRIWDMNLPSDEGARLDTMARLWATAFAHRPPLTLGRGGEADDMDVDGPPDEVRASVDSFLFLLAREASHANCAVDVVPVVAAMEPGTEAYKLGMNSPSEGRGMPWFVENYVRRQWAEIILLAYPHGSSWAAMALYPLARAAAYYDPAARTPKGAQACARAYVEIVLREIHSMRARTGYPGPGVAEDEVVEYEVTVYVNPSPSHTLRLEYTLAALAALTQHAKSRTGVPPDELELPEDVEGWVRHAYETGQLGPTGRLR